MGASAPDGTKEDHEKQSQPSDASASASASASNAKPEKDGTRAAEANGASSSASAPSGAQAEQTREQPEKQEEEPRQPYVPAKCHYEALGVQATATESEIKKAYYDLSRVHHPDKNQQDPDAKVRFQRIGEAYQELRDRTKRAKYDATKFLEPIFQSIGQPVNEMVANWVSQNLVPGAKVESMEIDRRYVEQLNPNLRALQNHCQAQFYQFHTHTRGVVLIVGQPANITRGRQALREFMEELTGTRAPRDGLVFIVPPNGLNRMPMMAANFQNLSWQYGAHINQVAQDRIVARGGPRLPAVVAQLQQWMDFRGTVQFPDGQTLDAWQYAHACELGGITGGLEPPREPDAAAARGLMCHALQMATSEQPLNLLQLAVRCLQSKIQLTKPLARAVSCESVYAEYQRLPSKQGAPLVCAFAQKLISQTVTFHRNFTTDSNVQTLMRLGPFLDGNDGIVLRSKGYIAAKETVPPDGQWHKWEEVLRPDGRLAIFWKDLRKLLQEKPPRHGGMLPPPAEWHSVPEVMATVLKHCVGSDLQLDPQQGLLRKPEPAAPAAPQAPSGESSGAAEAAVPEVSEELTQTEEAEDVIHGLSKQRDSGAYLELGHVTQNIQKRSGQTDKISKKWYEQYKLSFDVQKVGSSDFRVKLTPSGYKRAEVRSIERERECLRKQERDVAEAVLKRLQQQQDLPRTLREPELCALLLLAGETSSVSSDLPAMILKRLCAKPEGGKGVSAADLLGAIRPFNTSQVMNAIVSCSRLFRLPNFDEDSLVAIMQAAALDMHDTEKNPRRFWAPLQVVRDCVLSAGRAPFVDLFKQRKSPKDKMLVASAALRVSMEVSKTEENACPVCLSDGYSNFEPFAELCAALANLYYLVSPHIQEESVTEAFDKLAMACQSFCNCISNRKPSGLARLAYAFATMGSFHQNQKQVTASQLGLAQVCKVLLTSDMKEANGWHLADLNTIAASYATSTLKDEKLFSKLAAATAEISPEKLKRDQVLKTIHSFNRAGFLKKLEPFLKQLAAKSWFKKNLADPQEKQEMKDVPALVAGMICSQDFSSLDEVEKHLRKDRKSEVPMSTLVSIVRELSDNSNTKAVNLKRSVLNMVVTAMKGSKAPPNDELERLLQVGCYEDEASLSLLREVCCNRRRLESIPRATAGWLDLISSFERLLTPFTKAKTRVPRLEAACAGRLMEALEKKGVLQSGKQHDPNVLKNVLTAGLLFSPEAFASMPSLVQTLAVALGHMAIPRSTSDEADQMKALVKKMMPVSQSEGDDVLDTWTEQLEGIVADGNDSEKKWDRVEMMMKQDKERSRLYREINDGLGQSWLSILLARSKKISWMGGLVIRAHPARPRAALRDLGKKMETGGILGMARLKVTSLEPEDEPPAPRVNRGAGGQGEAKPKAKAKVGPQDGQITVSSCSDPRLGFTLEGQYVRDGTNHNKAVYRRIAPDPKGSVEAIKLYYWDDRDGKGDQGWWFGPKVGGPEVWMHNPKALQFPPEDGWDFGLKVALNRRAPGAAPKGKAKGKGKVSPPAPPAAPKAEAAAPSMPDGRDTASSPAPASTADSPKAAPAVPSAPPAKKAKVEEVEEDRFAELKTWLRSLNSNKPEQMMGYYGALVSEFDGDLRQIAAARIEDNPKASQVDQVEPSFWGAINCTKAIDKILFAKGIAKLPAA
ncbi:Chaperone protein DnaJ [Durusdinium trenchii]|uniref:Chaperone protein DnaJ n=1 Tax=Durusdinium trenchii TaxID=1381693 RepID=A0ABP0RDM1_9DINO